MDIRCRWRLVLFQKRKGIDRLAAANVTNYSLTDFDCIAKVAAETGYIKEEDIVRLIRFRNNPADESWITGGNKE